jgi:hypothetical protein
MNPRWLLVRRMRGPAFLVLFGITALLNQFDILSFGQSWPLYLILAGLIALAERAAFQPEMPPYPGTGQPSAYGGYQPPATPAPGTSIVPASPSTATEGLASREGER